MKSVGKISEMQSTWIFSKENVFPPDTFEISTQGKTHFILIFIEIKYGCRFDIQDLKTAFTHNSLEMFVTRTSFTR